MMRSRALFFSLGVIALSWAMAIMSCSSFTKQTEEVPATSAIKGCEFASYATISPELVSVAEAYTLYCYGQLFGLRGELDRSLEEFAKASVRLPESGYIDLEQARVLLEGDRVDAAIEKLDSAISKSPGMAEAYVLRGDANRMLLRIPEAVRDYRRGAELGFDEATLRFTIAELLKLAREYNEAILELQRLKVLEPNSLRADFSLGTLYLSIGEPAKAIPHLEAVVEAYPDDLHTITQLFEAYQQCKQFDNAIVLARTMVARLPKNSQLRYFLASFMEQAGRTDEAIKELEILIKVDPSFAAALNYLGYIYIDRGMKLQRGISLVRAALAIEPHNSAFLDSLGWGLYKFGDLKAAVEYLERAIAGLEDPASEPVICGHLAMAYQRTGNPKEAQKYLKIAESATSDPQALRQLLREFSSASGTSAKKDAASASKDASQR
ncbi:MAG: tetratricopeptide repeat protein [Candidatus Coatesbacteria bacterium]|nr:tetratricopeptide repeat protein [Candidatus Coatesbacteria bacterium]